MMKYKDFDLCLNLYGGYSLMIVNEDDVELDEDSPTYIIGKFDETCSSESVDRIRALGKKLYNCDISSIWVENNTLVVAMDTDSLQKNGIFNELRK